MPACSGSGKSTLVHDVLYRNLLAAAESAHRGSAGRLQESHRRAPSRPGGDGRSIPPQPHAALQPRPLYLGVFDTIREIFAACAGFRGAGPDRERVFLQYRRGPLRAMQRQRLREDRDAVPERRLRALPGVRRQTLPVAHPRHSRGRQVDPRRARADGHAGDPFLQRARREEDHAPAGRAGARWVWSYLTLGQPLNVC